MKKVFKPLTIYMIIFGGWFFAARVIFTVDAIYKVTLAGFSPIQLVLAGTIMEVAIFITEVPTGVVADVYSRRLSVIIGYVLIGFAFVLEGLIPRFWPIMIAQVFWGVGYTFTSGAREAWLADETNTEIADQGYIRAVQIGQLGALAGIIVGATLGTVQLNIPIIIGGVLHWVLALFLILFMPEDGFKPTPRKDRNTWQAMRDTLQEGVQVVRGRPLLISLMLIGLLFGLYSEPLDRLWEAHLLANFTFPLADRFDLILWFGLINFVGIILTLITTEITRRHIDMDDQRRLVRLLLIIAFGIVVALIVFGLAQNFWVAIGAFWLIYFLRRVDSPLQLAWINRTVEKPEVRATVMSMQSQMDAIGQMTGGPILGALATRISLRVALVAAGFVLSPVMLVYARLFKRNDQPVE